MSGLEDLERRVAAVEDRLALESDLRASADRDLADVTEALRAQQRSIQALAITQSQHTRTLAQHTVILDQQSEALGRLESSLGGLRQDHGAKLGQIITMLDRLTDEGGKG